MWLIVADVQFDHLLNGDRSLCDKDPSLQFVGNPRVIMKPCEYTVCPHIFIVVLSPTVVARISDYTEF